MEDRDDNSLKADGAADGEGSIRYVALSFLEKTSAHGLPRVATEKSAGRRMVWCIIFLVALVYFLAHFYGQYRKYESHPVAVRTGIMRRNVFTFPAVTICNVNMLKSSKLASSELSSLVEADKKAEEELEKVINRNTTSEDRRRKRRDVVVIEDFDDECYFDNPKLCNLSSNRFDEALEMTQTSDMSDLSALLRPTWEELELFGYDADEFIGQCSFDNKPCWPSNFSLIRESELGNCFVFNSAIHGGKTVLQTNRVGLRYGLRLTLVVSQDDFIGLLAHDAGVRVTVHSPWFHPFPNDQAVFAGTGLKTVIGARLQKQSRLPSPYPTQCTDGKDTKLDYPGNYTVLACEATCRRQLVYNSCHCLPNVISPNDTRLCSSLGEGKCMASVIRSIDNGLSKCNCQPACTVEKYSLSLSSTPWPSEAFTPYVKWQGLDEGWLDIAKLEWGLTQNLVRVHVFVDDPDVVTTDEYPAYPWESLLADTGGYLGLFIGVSLCTVLEMIEFFIDLVLFLVKRQRQKNNVTDIRTPVKELKTPQMKKN